MFTVRRPDSENQSIIEFHGIIEESVHFEVLIGKLGKSLTVNCRGITRINSVGVRNWIKYFQKICSEGVKVKFEECSPAVVEQLNIISNFKADGEVVSIMLPYACKACSKEYVICCQTEGLNPDMLPLAKCEREDCCIQFDDVESDYFHFLQGK
jgi:hypothetical protein